MNNKKTQPLNYDIQSVKNIAQLKPNCFFPSCHSHAYQLVLQISQ